MGHKPLCGGLWAWPSHSHMWLFASKLEPLQKGRVNDLPGDLQKPLPGHSRPAAHSIGLCGSQKVASGQTRSYLWKLEVAFKGFFRPFWGPQRPIEWLAGLVWSKRGSPVSHSGQRYHPPLQRTRWVVALECLWTVGVARIAEMITGCFCEPASNSTETCLTRTGLSRQKINYWPFFKLCALTYAPELLLVVKLISRSFYRV